MEMPDTIKILREYLDTKKGIKFSSDKEFEEYIAESGKRLDTKFKNIEAKNNKSIREFYSNSIDYLPDLAIVNSWDVFNKRGDFVANISKANNLKTILDYGGGCGWSSLIMAKKGLEVTYVDFKGILWEFAEWLFEREKVNVKMLTVEEFMESEEKYNIVFSSDVLEHVYHFGRVLIKLCECCSNVQIHFYCFIDDGNLAQHINLDPDAFIYMNEIFRMHGFNSEQCWRKNVWLKCGYYGYKNKLK